jgi:hypothetical protein
MTDQCPVPKNQRPLSEYNELKNSFGFNWTLTNPDIFFRKVLTFLAYIFFSITTVVFVSFKWEDHYFSWIVFTSFLVFTTWILRLYLAWLYIYDRLMNATITYEESGWYDGQTWIKTNEVLIQDRLIGVYEVFPILKKLQLVLSLSVPIILVSLYINLEINV